MSLSEKIAGMANMVVAKAEKHSPEILFVVGCVGVVATAVTAFRAYPKAKAILETHKNDMELANEANELAKPEDGYNVNVERLRICGNSTKEMAVAMAPTVLLGVGTVVAFGAALKILNGRYIGAVAWGTSVADAFSLYRGRVKDELGDEMDEHFRYGTRVLTKERTYIDEDGVETTEHTFESAPTDDGSVVIGDVNPSDIMRYFDEDNDNWDRNPTFNLMFLRAQEKLANDKFHRDGHLFLNDVYDMLGFKDTPIGAVVGWVKGESDFVDFGLGKDDSDQVRRFINNNRNVVPLDFNVCGVIWNKI